MNFLLSSCHLYQFSSFFFNLFIFFFFFNLLREREVHFSIFKVDLELTSSLIFATFVKSLKMIGKLKSVSGKKRRFAQMFILNYLCLMTHTMRNTLSSFSFCFFFYMGVLPPFRSILPSQQRLV